MSEKLIPGGYEFTVRDGPFAGRVGVGVTFDEAIRDGAWRPATLALSDSRSAEGNGT
jgi:hypothetical protein